MSSTSIGFFRRGIPSGMTGSVAAVITTMGTSQKRASERSRSTSSHRSISGIIKSQTITFGRATSDSSWRSARAVLRGLHVEALVAQDLRERLA